MTNIKFGTDGWRAVIGDEFNDRNVLLVINSIGKYVFEKYGIKKALLVGFDPRNKADYYAKTASEILAGYGFDVYCSSRVVPTPVLAYCAKNRNACAVMFTASHNPPEYLGIKFIPDYAGPASSEITDKLTENLGKSFITNCSSKQVNYADFSFEYFAHIKKLIDFNAIKSLDKNIIFDGLYSAGIGYFDKLLSDNRIKFKALHMEYDPNFGGGMPDPKPEYLKELIKKVKAERNSIGCANDGDSDRFGFINEAGEYVTPNEIIGILLIHLAMSKKMTGCLVKTIASSMMLDKLAQKLDIGVIETPVGFKYIGEAMRENDCLIGGEESGGLSIKGHIPEKDGILANLLILEAMAYSKKPMTKLQEELKKLVGAEFYNDRIDLRLNNLGEIEEISGKLCEIETAAGMNAEKFMLKGGMRINFGKNNRILVRPSGTEPLMRIYFESDSITTLEQLKKDICLIF